MEFENTFDVPAPIDEVYAALLDVQRVAPCVPGAEVLEQTGEDSYKVAIKVKVGPMSMKYTGDVDIVEKDEAAHRAVMRAKAREARGQGTVNSLVVMKLTGAEGRTTGEITTDVQLSGRVASMGRGIIQDVSARIVDQFSENLAEMLAGSAAPAAPAEAAAPSAAAPGVAAPSAAAPPPPPPPPKPAASSELSAADVAGAVVMGRLKEPKGLAIGLGLAALIGFLIGRRRR
jgi:carbon monoxide dehydrogenase subunit G